MFTVEPYRYTAKIFGTWFLFTLLAVFSAGILPSLLTIPAAGAVVWLTYWCFDCAYRTERFSKYATLRMFTNLTFAPGFTSLLLLIITYKQFKLSASLAILLSCIPLILAASIYLFLYQMRSSKSCLVVSSQRVEVIESVQQNQWILGAIGAGVGTLIYPVFHAYKSPTVLLMFLFSMISVFMFFYHRNNIAALRALKEREQLEGKEYTFMEIEELRSKRAASWIGRLFANKANH
ncbi:hypothetical protein [Pseudomonas sp. LP_7_YM]|uniref:hypothetical protein n=1 Tax=Pseudomonas sp. LP_7_YM TaxID=2485137 RepID=UPI00105ED5A6|nr:hypothetical protein [Pseudomonas sp. LP_7_YM]TDV58955.1 hypothetical protein EC915_1216 [Pseudomonas sp. LP_7_YM]